MIRSYALTCAAITLRVILGIGLASGQSFYATYLVAAWACWIVNIIIAEIIIARLPAPGLLRRAA